MNLWKQTRFQFIEVIVFWESEINSRRLINTFGISRMQAFNDFREYKYKHPDVLGYNHANKTYYLLYDDFPEFGRRPSVNDYFSMLYFFEKPMWLYSFGCPGRSIRQINTNVVSKIFSAIQKNKAVQVSYKALESAKDEIRIIKPTKIINTGSRWHVRGLRDKNGQLDYRDFLLSRFTKWHNSFDSTFPRIEDSSWNKQLKIKLKINPKIKNRERRDIISAEFGLTNERLEIDTNAALVKYILDSYTVDVDSEACSYEKNLLVIENFDEIKRYLLKPMDLSDERL